MTIKITELQLKKDKIIATHHIGNLKSHDISKLEGDLIIELNQGIAKGIGKLHISALSEKLRNKLYNVLNEIEDELNCVETSFTQLDNDDCGRPTDNCNTKVKLGQYSWVGTNIEDGGKIATFHTGEVEAPPIKLEVDELLKSSSILQNIMKNISPKLDKLHETDTNKEVDAVSDALDKVEKVFNLVFNVSEHKSKTAKELVDEIAKAMRTKGMF